MAFIPKDAVWYIAQVVLEIVVEGEAQNVVHINYILVRAESPEDAYKKALRLGTEHESTYFNGEKKKVKISFRGLHNLTLVYEALEHGAELLYTERLGVSQTDLVALIRPKESLGVFKPIQRSPGPNYSSEEVQREAKTMMGESE